MKKSKYRLLIIIILLLLGSLFKNNSFAEAKIKDKNILIVNSHTEDYAWTRDVLKGIFKVINPSEFNINIYVENFDHKYYQKDDIDKDIYRLIKKNYENKNIDLLITTDLDATKFAIDHQDELFKEIPIVFSGLSKAKAKEITSGVSNISGIIEKLNIDETLETAFNIIPNAKTIYVIHDNTSRGMDAFDQVKDSANKIDKKIEVKTFAKIEDIKFDIKTPDIDEDSIVIGTITMVDSKGLSTSMAEIAGKLSKKIDSPIFYLQEEAIGHGVLGGSMLSSELHGKNTGEIALRVLNGEEPDNIGLVEENNAKNIYDYNILEKYNINENLLPDDSEIINKPFSFYGQYKIIIILISLVIILLTVLVIYLLLNIYKRKQMESNMKIINKELLSTQDELQIMAYYDDVVNLPNRNMFFNIMEERFNNTFKSQASGSILYMDIDNFKNINDTFGHAFGNLFLKAFAERLKSVKSIESEDNNIFRLNGDEYIIVLEDRDSKETEIIAEEIHNSFKTPFTILNEDIKVSISMGIVFYPEHGDTVDEVFKKADLAMYKVKELGKNGYKIYQSEMEEEVADKVLLENNLRNALDKDEFILHYQPQINSKTGEIVGFESLIRWNSSQYGLISPVKFIPLAEETGEINKIGGWVLREACKFAISVSEKYDKKIEVSVNISPVQLKKPDFIPMVRRILKETGAESCLLGIEVTETALMESFEENIAKLKQLRDMGITIYLDDFGTGYSSLSYLLKLPINTIKIDKSFIDDMMIEKKGRKIIGEIINLAHDIDLSVVAEGVEIEEQLSVLKELGCDIIQGYIYSKPLAERDAYIFLDANLSKI
nr:ABC transporter substrate binding protein [Tissierella sp.]